MSRTKGIDDHGSCEVYRSALEPSGRLVGASLVGCTNFVASSLTSAAQTAHVSDCKSYSDQELPPCTLIRVRIPIRYRFPCAFFQHLQHRRSTKHATSDTKIRTSFAPTDRQQLISSYLACTRRLGTCTRYSVYEAALQLVLARINLPKRTIAQRPPVAVLSMGLLRSQQG